MYNNHIIYFDDFLRGVSIAAIYQEEGLVKPKLEY